jgi:uncharacterized protein (DUF433 family)
MATAATTFFGIVHGKTIELDREPGIPAGQRVTIQIQTIDEAPAWLTRFTANASVAPGKLLIQGTELLVENLIEMIEAGRSDEELRKKHPELTPADLHVLHEYASVPADLRGAFGGWSEDVEELDRCLEWTRQQRHSGRREIAD